MKIETEFVLNNKTVSNDIALTLAYRNILNFVAEVATPIWVASVHNKWSQLTVASVYTSGLS